jgi:hypothetical protein
MADVRVEHPFAMADDWSQATRSDRMHKRECGDYACRNLSRGDRGTQAQTLLAKPAILRWEGSPMRDC